MRHSKPLLLPSLILFLFGLLLFGSGIGRVHLFDWDEINFAESAREMLVTGNYLDVQVNFETFWEKPPLFIWMQAASMWLFGVGEFGARFPNAVAGGLTLVVLFLLGSRLSNVRFGLLWSALYTTSFLPFFYFKSGIIDPWFNLFIFLGIYYMACYTEGGSASPRKQTLRAFLSALFIGLATLTKGPVAFLIFALVFAVYLVMARFRLSNFKWADVLLYIVTFAIVGGLWFILQIANGNLSIIEDFILYQIRLFETQDAGHGGFPMYHFVVLFLGVFPASILMLPTLKRGALREEHDATVAHHFRWMMVTLWVVLILFSIVRTKIVHYSSMCYFPITFLAAWSVDKWLYDRGKMPKGVQITLVVVGMLLGLAVVGVTLIDQLKPHLIPYIQDEFAVANLQATSPWGGWEWLIGALLMLTVLLYIIGVGRSKQRAFMLLLGGSLLFIYLGSFVITPKVEVYSQRAMIEFLKERRGEECYILPNFKSYAHYFYSERQPHNNVADEAYLLRGDIDKVVYFIIKQQYNDEADFVARSRNAVRLYDKNGYIFYARYPGGEEILEE